MYNFKKHTFSEVAKIGTWSLEDMTAQQTKTNRNFAGGSVSSQQLFFFVLLLFINHPQGRSTWKQIANLSFFFLFALDFQENYNAPSCKGDPLPGNVSSKTSRVDTPTAANNSVVAYLLSQSNASVSEIVECNRASSLLFLLLMFGTVWIGVSLYNFNKT